MTTDFTTAIVRTIVGMTGAVLLATTFVGAATAPAKAATTISSVASAKTISSVASATVQTSLSTRSI